MRFSPAVRRHKLAALAVLVVALACGYQLKRAAPTYTASANVVFAARRPVLDSAPRDFRDSLIATEVMMSQDLASQAVQSRILASGGNAGFTLSPFNLYDIQYPNFSVPIATLTSAAPTLADAQRTFAIVRAYLVRRLTSLEDQAGVPARHRLDVYIAADKSTTIGRGSRARVFGALAALTIIVLFMVTALLDCRIAAAPPHRSVRGRNHAVR